MQDIEEEDEEEEVDAELDVDIGELLGIPPCFLTRR